MNKLYLQIFQFLFFPNLYFKRVHSFAINNIYQIQAYDHLLPYFPKYGLMSSCSCWDRASTENARCDADVLIVHHKNRKKNLLGNLEFKKRIMFNDFVLVGPKVDPANIKNNSVKKALKKIFQSKFFYF